MIVHEPIDNVCSTNQLLYYSYPKTSEDAHKFIMALQNFLLDELENSEKIPGRTVYGEVYDNNLYVSMKAFWDLFTGEITHEYTCTSCKNTSQNHKQIDYLLLKFPDEHHYCDLNCTVEYLIQYHLQEEKMMTISAGFAIKLLQQRKSLPLLSIPPSCAFYSVALEETIMAPFLQQFSFLPLALT
jgi:hypothetical protein